MKRRSQLMGLAAALLLVGCSNGQQTATSEGANSGGNQAGQPQGQAIKPQKFANPVISPLTKVKAEASTAKVPGLMPQTNGKQRAATLVAGRPDPFAQLTNSGPITVTLPPSATMASAQAGKLGMKAPNAAIAQPTKSAMKPASLKIPPLPTPLSNLPMAPLPPLATGPLPVPGLPTAPPVSKTATADAIQVTGVIQMQGKWHVIVKESETDSSRYVSAGDKLAGGRVSVKQIVTGGSAEPMVIFQENGVEVTKSIGGPLAQL